MEIEGNTTGLNATATRALERIHHRRVPADRILTVELARTLVDASVASGRQVGVLVHRSGNVERVVVGDATRLLLPDLGRLRASQGRFRGLRLVHTHLRGEPLSHDDLVDLLRLRLDLVAAVEARGDGGPGRVQWAHLLPENPRGALWRVEDAPALARLETGTDFRVFIRELEDEFARVSRGRPVAREGRAVLVHVCDKRRAHRVRDSLRELRELARSAGVEVVDEVSQVRDAPDGRTVLGRGKLDEVAFRALQRDADVLIFDQNLAPAQASSVAAATDLKVLDRTQLILDIFAQRAETRDGRLQVELAQLRYMLPRLGQKDDALSRLTGGIGGRGPGETRLEIAGRRARDRIKRLEDQLRELSSQRRQRRARRGRSGVPVAALIGYTNAGKSTLMNTLTGAGVVAENRMFATLDPRSRRLRLGPPPAALAFTHGRESASPEPSEAPSGASLDEVILTDTVGFIRDLPRDLVAAFRATFEETAEADLLVHVVDASDPCFEEHLETTEQLLEALDLTGIPRLLVFNKADAAPPGVAQALARTFDGVAVEATSPGTLGALKERLRQALCAPRARPEAGSAPPWARTA
ncbi:MAG: GTPase HflX [Deltaproteobacteria bacterium]|nr:GTPase HflX [Deltaproteobacteria bacterium]